MVTTRSGRNIKKVVESNSNNNNDNNNNNLKKSPNQIVNEVIEDLYMQEFNRANVAEKELENVKQKCKMLEYELMVVRNQHVNLLNQVEDESKDRQFYFIFWLTCSFFLQATYLYFAFA